MNNNYDNKIFLLIIITLIGYINVQKNTVKKNVTALPGQVSIYGNYKNLYPIFFIILKDIILIIIALHFSNNNKIYDNQNPYNSYLGRIIIISCVIICIYMYLLPFTNNIL